jgi:tetratricopeptide (TPR) repeat protein
MGEVITFYSFKGGVGRTMGLANIAALYAHQGRRVLALDFDFEAPGLHRYFLAPRDEGLPLRHTPLEPRQGILNYWRFVFDELERLYPDGEGFDTDEVQKQLPAQLGKWLDSGDYIYEIEIFDPNTKALAPEKIRFIPAARFDDTYPELVRSFDWQRLYDLYAEVFPAFAKELSRRYDAVLIDSRTGVTDIGSICTMLLPHKLVLAFTPNKQSLEGVLDAGLQAIRGRQAMQRPTLYVYPLLSRLEDSEEKLKRLWLERSQKGFERLFCEGYGLASCNLDIYFDAVRVPHRGYFAYGERIAVEEYRTTETGSLAEVYNGLMRCLDDNGVLAAQESIRESGFTPTEGELRRLAGMMQSGSFHEAAKLQAFMPVVSLANARKEALQGRMAEALAICDDILLETRAGNTRLAQLVLADALNLKALLSRNLGQPHEAMAALNEVIERFAKDDVPWLKQLVADAHALAGNIWTQLHDHDKALQSWDKAIERYAHSNLAEARVKLAETLNEKADCLIELGEEDRARATYAEVVRRFADASETPLQRAVSTAMWNKSVVFFRNGQLDERREIIKDLILRFRECRDAEIRRIVGRALFADLFDVAAPDDVERVIDDIIARLEPATNEPDTVALALSIRLKASGLSSLERYTEAIEVANDWISRYRHSEQSQISDMLSDVLRIAAKATLYQAKRQWLAGDEPVARKLLEDAAAKAAEGLALKGDDVDLLQTSAYIAFLRGDAAAARAWLQQAANIDPQNIRENALEYADKHPLPQDEAFRALVEELSAKAST